MTSEPYFVVVSDTHDLLRPELLDSLGDAQVLIHAGDFVSESTFRRLESRLPILAVRGNGDRDGILRQLPQTRRLELFGAPLLVCHDERHLPLESSGVLTIVGHTHLFAWDQATQVLNPGSAGPLRGGAPATIARCFRRGNVWHVERRILAPHGGAWEPL